LNLYSGNDSALAENLVTILTNSEQEVPDFLAAYASGGGAGNAGGGDFGGSDQRGGAVAEEEDWG